MRRLLETFALAMLAGLIAWPISEASAPWAIGTPVFHLIGALYTPIFTIVLRIVYEILYHVVLGKDCPTP